MLLSLSLFLFVCLCLCVIDVLRVYLQFCDEMADAGKIVILAALDGDFRREPFGAVLQLAPRSESFVRLCVCLSLSLSLSR